MSCETAIFVLSGKLLDANFPLSALDAIRTALERETTARGLAIVRRVATLSPSRFDAATEFLKAGFEVVPADDEDVQATALLFGAVASPTPTTELIFALGLSEPLELLRAFAGRTRRVLLTTADVSPQLEANLEGLYDLRALLANDGVDWDSFAAPNADFNVEPSPTNADSNADLYELAPEAGPDALELDAPAWNAALEELLLANSLSCSAYLATEQISDRFPGLPEFFLTQREEFRRLLSPQIAMIEEDSSTRFYHKTHPQCRPLTLEEALNALAPAPSQTTPFEPNVEFSANNDDEKANAETDAEAEISPAKLVERFQLIARQCRWSAERESLIQNGANFQDEIEPQDREFEEQARRLSTFLWPIARRLTPEAFEEAAQCYEIASQAFALFAQVLELPRNPQNDAFFNSVAQAAANAQCGLKSVLSRFNLPLSVDGTQRDAYELLLNRCGSRGIFLANLRYQDRLNLAETVNVAAEVAELSQKFESLRARAKERRSLEGKIDFHLKKIAVDPNSLYDWDKIVEATTILCDSFRMPPSSLWFRRRLLDYVDQIPDAAQTSDAFARVVQEIDLYRMREEEELEALFEFSEREYSPAVQAVRDRYAGAQAVFVGGTPQQHLQARLEKYLNVRLVWSETSHGDSLERFAGFLRDDETRLFLIYIPWCSHKHSEEFATLIKEANKDCVRLRKGTNPEQIAQAICRQFRLLPESQL